MVGEITIRKPDPADVINRDDDEGFDSRAECDAKLLVRIGVDGMFTIVNLESRTTSPMDLIEKSIAALTEFRQL